MKRRRIHDVLALVGLDGTEYRAGGAEVLPQDLRLELREVEALQVARVGQHLGDNRAPGFGVRGQLDFDDDQSPGRFDSQQVSVAVAQATSRPRTVSCGVPARGSICGASRTRSCSSASAR